MQFSQRKCFAPSVDSWLPVSFAVCMQVHHLVGSPLRCGGTQSVGCLLSTVYPPPLLLALEVECEGQALSGHRVVVLGTRSWCCGLASGNTDKRARTHRDTPRPAPAARATPGGTGRGWGQVQGVPGGSGVAALSVGGRCLGTALPRVRVRCQSATPKCYETPPSPPPFPDMRIKTVAAIRQLCGAPGSHAVTAHAMHRR